MAGLYIHFPFCSRKCRYCDFCSVVFDPSILSPFCDALEQEIRMAGASRPHSEKWTSVYLGGGTPSLLPPERLLKILDLLDGIFGIAAEAEITAEANPESTTSALLKAWRSLGINRISLGVQSLEEEELAVLGRLHTAKQAETAMNRIGETGFRSWNADLMVGLPDQTLHRWDRTLLRTVSFGPSHMSVYGLTLHQGTPLAEDIKMGRLHIPDEDASAGLWLFADSFLADQGFEHYEISNWARPGRRCRHNEAYWSREPYLGFGPSAHSFFDHCRQWNVSSIPDYIGHLAAGKMPVEGQEILDPEAERLEAIDLNLRRQEGIPESWVRTKHAYILEMARTGFLIRQKGRLHLTSRGMLLADEISKDLAF
jgi:oxygen-independent coproporphyrinogen-3 oxidase